MNEWRCYSTKDMVNWTDHGQIAHAQTFDKESKSKENWRAWAQQVVEMPIKENGTWVKKYFLFAPFNGTKIDVAVADKPEGPFQDATPGKYLIDGGWDGGTGSNRSVCVKEFDYDENNLIKKETPDNVSAYMVQGMKSTVKGTPYFSVDPIGTLNPYDLNQAETICWESNLDGAKGGFNGTGRGVKTKSKAPATQIDPVTGKTAFWQSAALGGVAVYDIDNNDFIRVREADFGNDGAKSFTISAACSSGTPLEKVIKDNKGLEIANPNADTSGGTVEIWLDYTDPAKQKLVGSVDIGHTGGTNIYSDFRTNLIETVTGKHDVQFVFKGEAGKKLFNLDTWHFMKEETTPTLALPVPTPTATPVPTASATAVVPTATVSPAPTAVNQQTAVSEKTQP